MKYSTVVLDLDGTLTNSEKRVTDRTCLLYTSRCV